MDVHIPFAITQGLRNRGVDVLTAQEMGLREAEDEKLLSEATSLNRLLFTQDDDFLAIASDWSKRGNEFKGIIYAHQLGPSIGQIVEDLNLLISCGSQILNFRRSKARLSSRSFFCNLL